MAKATNRALLLCALTLSGMLILGPAQAKEEATVVAALPGVPTSDDVLKRAIDYLQESKQAQQRQIRRDNMKPVPQEKVVHRRSADKLLILGVDGGNSLPM
ncbi:MAG: hypothetical protein ACRD3W_13015 [Terriglobales bacterium]